MRSLPPFGSHWQLLLVWLALSAGGAFLAGCNNSQPPHRPASALSAHQAAVLDAYEKVRAGLAKDDPRAVRAAAIALQAELKKSNTDPTSPRLVDACQALVDAKALDTMRTDFVTVSELLVPVAAGVDGYYILTSPPGFTGDWIQRAPEVENPYFGRAMSNAGSVKK